ncbi:type III secretion system protein SctP [Paraburkholderia sp. JPY419]|uniref:type III secretion system protein SctP n=1 Tax=Paraburkholderia sp. JPY419 TaxID=667660 RepID=UPI003D25A483
MTSIHSRRLRVFPVDDHADDGGAWSQTERSSKFDYASLLRGGPSLHRPVGREPHAVQPAGAHGGGAGDGGSPASRDGVCLLSAGLMNTRLDSMARAPASADAAGNDGIGPRVEHASEALVASVFASQQRVLDIVGTLAHEITGFANDRAIATAGNWDVRMPLDETLFPHTTLYLTLSPFVMQLRFDAPDPATRQLLLDHSAMLERELDAILSACGNISDIQITVW